MPFRILLQEDQTGPVPASGPHAELLGDIEATALLAKYPGGGKGLTSIGDPLTVRRDFSIDT